tara:strand:- start:277 stop:585 length:309 start_codon:yes stop_codon:yes gene_type:complete
MEKIAFGQLGMNVDDFYNMLPREFWNKVDGFYELENMRQRSDWERTRWSTCLLLNIQMAKGKSIKPTDLIVFEWEEDKKKIDFEDLKNKAELYKKKIEHGSK